MNLLLPRVPLAPPVPSAASPRRVPLAPPVRVLRLAVCLALTLAAGMVHAASPNLGGIEPRGGQRGTELEVHFNGERLADAEQILLFTPGIEVTQLQATADNSVLVKFKIAADCRLGAHPMRVRTRSGISNLRTFHVGALAELAEQEPNSDFAQPQAIELDRCLNGTVDNEDVDYFTVTAKQGERITAEIEGIRLGDTFFDPYVAILDAGRFELARSDDASLVWQDGVASLLAPADGTYTIQVRECSYGGNGACRYRLHVGRFPRPTVAFPLGGRPGTSLEVRWLGDLAGEQVEQALLPADVQNGFGLFRQEALGIAPSANSFRLTDLDNALEVEPNNGPTEASPCPVPGAACGVLSAAGDADFFQFKAAKGQVLDLTVFARQVRSPVDPVLVVYRAGASLAGNDDNGQPDSYLRFTAPEDDTYTLSVTDHLGQGGPDYAYRVELTPVVPKLTLGLPERSQFVDITVPVPRGNRTAFLVSASRVDFGGDLNIALEGLPAGTTVESLPMPANQTLVPVLVSAAADAPLAGALVDVVGKPVDAALPVVGHLLQRTSLVRGQNNIHVWDVDTYRLAMAVSEEVPFTLEVIDPKVPLVHDGTMQLKVVAHRKEGFAAPIALRMLYDPPGVGSSGGVVIAEGQTEALIPINANSGAEVKTWRIAVLGEATVGNGPVTVSSQLANLTISPPFIGLAFQNAAVEQGKTTDVVIQVTKNLDFEGPAQVELLGLPNEVTTAVGQITKDSTELVFPVQTTANSPAGKHRTLLCRATIVAQGEPITHMIGTGELRIDAPVPPPPGEPVAAAPVEAPPTEKRLTLLEKMRLERQQRKEARRKQLEAQAAAPAATDTAATASAETATPAATETAPPATAEPAAPAAATPTP